MDKMPVRDLDAPRWGGCDGLDGCDGRCKVLKTQDAGRMSADGADEIDKMRDARWKRADEMESAEGSAEGMKSAGG